MTLVNLQCASNIQGKALLVVHRKLFFHLLVMVHSSSEHFGAGSQDGQVLNY